MHIDRFPAGKMQWARWIPRVLRCDVRCLNALDWRIVALLFAVAFCFAIHSLPADIFLNGLGTHATAAEYPLAVFTWFVRYLVQFGPVLLALAIADSFPLAGRKRLAALAIALLIGAQFQWPIRCTYEPQSEAACTLFRHSPWESWKAMSQTMPATIAFAMPLALVAFSRRRELRVRRALHAAEVERLELQRKTLEADLQGVQAQVEPAFLLDTLRRIGALCDDDPQTGARLLDEIITYLRAALPDLRATRSTLCKESERARAYLAILHLRSGRPFDDDVDVDESIEDAAIPSMIVLPLLAGVASTIGRQSAAHIGAHPASSGETSSSLGFGAHVADGNVCIEVTARGAGACDFARAPILEEIRARLDALYGERASLEVVSQRDALTTARLTIPHERL
ncbi:MAG TPA: histidine kinase [Casimicrobiaceae bacterium]|nr:histidine kinase [Casimicrobiaceae bacterium]